jgi:hypothetical protein
MLHDEEMDPVLMPDVVERADVGIVQRGDRAGFAVESFAPDGIACVILAEDFDRDGPIEAGVERLIDIAHAALAERRGDLIGAESTACGQRHIITRAGLGETSRGRSPNVSCRRHTAHANCSNCPEDARYYRLRAQGHNRARA